MERPSSGALVISLDFELHWGVRDHVRPGDAYWRNLEGERDAVRGMLALFEELDVAATWATVGFLFAKDKAELDAHRPRRTPAYEDARLDPFHEPVGADEASDPLHYAASLVEAIRRTPRQEVATHTYSHYYCREPGQTIFDFREDLRSAVAIAKARGVALDSIVLPRNQWNPAYRAALAEAGVRCYRGNQRGWMHAAAPGAQNSLPKRLARAADAYAGPRPSLVRWEDVKEPDGLANVAASHFLRPRGALDGLHLRRLERTLRAAARERAICHLWWHPHNFGADLPANLRRLRRLLEAFDRERDRHGMRSMSMRDVADAVGA